MSAPRTAPDRGPELLTLYDEALPQVYGYLLRRCGDRAVAEDLTSETFLACAAGLRDAPPLTVGWLIGVARHKLLDHWRRQARDQRLLESLPGGRDEDPWDVALDRLRAEEVLSGLGPHHRAVLTLRYLDDLPVPQVAAALDRTLHATEALLVRARAAFRTAYERSAGDES
ncbi:MAG TPA: sigma-70 family RNA polymerase sigma factor [Mycobacteriales bacterium]